MNRVYHEINTRYNIYFNAEQAYLEALEKKDEAYEDNLSDLIYMYPQYEEGQTVGGFEPTIDKTTKAIKLHSIQAKPERNPSKRGNIVYQEWLNQREFNPFLKNAWLLLAKAEYQKLDYLRSIATFSYITRLYKTDPEVVGEARLWIAKAYLQMGWVYEAENVFHQIEMDGGIPKKLENLYAEVRADLLIKEKKYEEAIPYLQQAAKSEGGTHSMRFKYLLGQLYAKTGNRQQAHEAFGKVQGLNTPHKYGLNARLQQSQFINPDNRQEVEKELSSLGRMAKQTKNEEYLDQIYYNIGNIYLNKQDTAKAIDNYNLAIEKSTRGGYDKAIAQIKLGDIYFQQRDYIHSQPLYPDALGALGKKYERYDELMLRSEILDKLVVYAQAIHLQDSLQTLARMPENERLDAIDKLIADLKKKEEEERKEQERLEWEQNRPDTPGSTPLIAQKPVTTPAMGGNQSSFYFYNPQTVTQGKTAFRNSWGNRKLEDNWRRRNKSSSGFEDFFAEESTDESLPTDSATVDQSGTEQAATQEIDKYSPEFYLKDIPLTPEALQESDDIIEDAYFNMGMIYKNDLFDFPLAIETFDMDLQRFPRTPNMEEIYYQLFLIYMQLGDKAMAESYRAKLLSLFPSGEYASTLSDPNYEYNLRNMIQLENNLYQETYDAYMVSRVSAVRTNFASAKEKFPLSLLMPKFMFLNALTYAQTNEPVRFKDQLSELVEKYPDSEVTPIASEMLKGVLSGRALVAGGPARGMIWDIPFGGPDISEIDTISQFMDNPETEYQVMLLFDPTKVEKNQLLYDVADYNFSNFILQTFDLNFTELNPFEILQVRGFGNLNDVAEYTNKIFNDSSLIEKLDSSIVIVPISVENYAVLTRGKSLNNYFEFFEKTYSKLMPSLIKYWKGQFEEAVEEEEEPEETTTVDAVVTIEPLVAEPDTLEVDEPVELEIKMKPKTEGVGVVVAETEGETTEAEELPDSTEPTAVDDTVDDMFRSANEINDALDAVADNPVDGIKSIISSIKNRPKLTKEEKETAKEVQRRQRELEKQQREREKAVQDSIKAVEKARTDSIKNAEKEKIEFEKAAQRAKVDAQKAAEKAREDARKAREKEREEKAKARERELKEKERARNEALKAKEKERNERLKQREKELKEKEKQREAERRERERQAKAKRR